MCKHPIYNFKVSDIRVNTSSDLKKNNGQKGQISVFLALGFLVLFTMFAMTINVGMVVHDKINVQNAADFASIYVAQRQAEMLNAIAHVNYQIRQAHKLLSYRYVVLGSAGIQGSQASIGPSNNESVLDPAATKVSVPLCIADRKILRFPGTNTDEWCRSNLMNNGFIGIPILEVVNSGIAGNYGLRSQTLELAENIRIGAALASAINWWFTANSMAAFKYQVAYRKALVKALATNLARPIQDGEGGMKDLYGDSVFEGAAKTFRFNLSESIRRTGATTIQVRNSIQGLAVETWLPEIAAYIVPTYVDYSPRNGGAADVGGGIQSAQATFYNQLPAAYRTDYPGARTQINSQLFDRVDPDSILRNLAANFPVPPGDDFEEILGFEKNPWYMIYNHVDVQVSSGALFSPLPTLSLRAQAFAKAFGGRIGPWYGRDWPRGNTISSDNKVEPLWPPRKLTAAQPTDDRDPFLLPNSPKFPGDENGLQTRLAQSSTGVLGDNGANVIQAEEYMNVAFDLMPGGSGQALSHLPATAATSTAMRERELSAIAPDLFDITYYSIEPNFHENYLEGKLDTWLMNEVRFNRGLTYNAPVWRDIGFSSASTELQQFKVKDQLQSPNRQTYASQVFYFLEASREGLANLLTSWVGGSDVMDYRSPASGPVSARFGNCNDFYRPRNGRPNIPGECLSGGGRVGYSVKIISKEYLESNQHRMSRDSTGAILNPPQNL